MMDIDWIAVDWGTTNLRAWGLKGHADVVAEADSDDGMNSLRPEEFESALMKLVGTWLPARDALQVLVCGMAGADGGWAKAPYRLAPCTPLEAEAAVSPRTVESRLRVRILPGIRQAGPGFDVMRGEETQVAGFLSHRPDFDGVICLPGTHTKWIRVRDGEIVRFRTFMSGELYALLGRESVLRHVVDDRGRDDSAFESAVKALAADPGSLAGSLFSIRAEALTAGLSPVTASARLSGALIGAELAAARPFWLDRTPVVVGSGRLAALYSTAIGTVGAGARSADAADMTLAGLASARARLSGGVPA